MLGQPVTVCTQSGDDPKLPSAVQSVAIGLSAIDLSRMAAADAAGDGLVALIQPLSAGDLETVFQAGGVEKTSLDGYPAGWASNDGTLSIQAKGVLIQVLVDIAGQDTRSQADELARAVLRYGFS